MEDVMSFVDRECVLSSSFNLNFNFGLCRSLKNLCPAMRYGVLASRLEWERCPGSCTASGIAMRTVSPESNVSAP